MTAFVINTAEPMAKMRVVTVRDDSERTLKTLQSIGVLDVAESDELNPVDRTAIEQAHREVNELTSYITKILSYLPEKGTVTIDEDIEVIYTEPFGEITDEEELNHERHERRQNRSCCLSSFVSFVVRLLYFWRSSFRNSSTSSTNSRSAARRPVRNAFVASVGLQLSA